MSIPDSTMADQMVTILMGVRNGAAHLPDQLRSIAAQTHTNWRLVCSDDGSADDTRSVIERFAQDHPGKVRLVDGPRAGFSANFMQLIRGLPADAGFVSFADQDDVWEADKISRALTQLQGIEGTPALYTVRCWYWYPALDRRIESALPTRPASFRNALIENIATGNTILLNPAAARLARSAAQQVAEVFAHDWWLYLLITGVGGQVVFDTGAPALLYRQHDSNAIGGGQTASAQVSRKIKVLQGAFADRIQSNLSALQATRDLLTPEAQELLDQFAQARNAHLITRLRTLRQIGPYRQTTIGNLGFWGAASLGRI